MGETKNLIRPK